MRGIAEDHKILFRKLYDTVQLLRPGVGPFLMAHKYTVFGYTKLTVSSAQKIPNANRELNENFNRARFITPLDVADELYRKTKKYTPGNFDSEFTIW